MFKKVKKTLLCIVLGFIICFLGIFSYSRLVEHRSVTSFALEKIGLFFRGTYPNDEDEIREYFEELQSNATSTIQIPSSLKDREVKEINIDGMQTLIWNDHNDPNQRVILFIHGGAYTAQASEYHYKFLNQLSDKLDAKIVFPVYTLVPLGTYKTAYPPMIALYQEVLGSVTDSKLITLSGDSAGGGFALGLADELVNRNIAQPKDIIVLSPWLDISLNNEDIQDYTKVDPLLAQFKLIQAEGVYWADGVENLKKPAVSPIFSQNYAKMGKISMFTGTHDLMYPDNTLLAQMLTAENIKHNYIIGENMNHIYPIYPIPEGREVIEQIVEIIKE